MIMLDSETLIKLRDMRLSGMAECFESLQDIPVSASLSTTETIKMAVDHEWERRRNAKLKRIQKKAALSQPYADVSDIRMVANRIIDIELISRLSVGSYLLKRQDIVLQGPTGSGKTFVACALANKACQQSYSTLYLSASELFDRLTFGDRAGERRRALETLVKVDLLVIDDWFLNEPSKEQVQQLHVLIDRRHRQASTIFCTQLTPAQWHDRMDEKVLADAIVDRITTNSYVTVLNCKDSLRRYFSSLEKD